MQTYDVLMLFVLLGSTLFGLWKGMAWQIASLASLIVSYFAARQFSDRLAPTFGEHAPLNKFVAMLVIYIVTSFVIWMIFRLVSRAIDRVRLESFDRQLGAILGFAKGILLCVAITFFAVTLLPQAQGEMIVASRTGRYIVVLLDKTHAVFPPEIHDVIHPYLNRIENKLDPNHEPHGPAPAWPTDWQQTQQSWPQTPQTSPQTWPTQPQPAQNTWPQSTTPAQGSNPNSNPNANPSTNPYQWPQEPQPYPGPYSAEAPNPNPY